jgi:hypothetical protein
LSIDSISVVLSKYSIRRVYLHSLLEENQDIMPSSTGWGKVRGSPYGSSPAAAARNGAATAAVTSGNGALGTTTNDKDKEWLDWRSQHLVPVHFPVDGYDHQNGQAVIDQVDSVPLGCTSSSAAAAATMPASLASSLIDKFLMKQQERQEQEQQGDFESPKEVHDYGSTKTIDDAPVGSLRDKWRLMPVSVYIYNAFFLCFDFAELLLLRNPVTLHLF